LRQIGVSVRLTSSLCRRSVPSGSVPHVWRSSTSGRENVKRSRVVFPSCVDSHVIGLNVSPSTVMAGEKGPKTRPGHSGDVRRICPSWIVMLNDVCCSITSWHKSADLSDGNTAPYCICTAIRAFSMMITCSRCCNSSSSSCSTSDSKPASFRVNRRCNRACAVSET